MTIKNLSGRLARWSLQLQGYNFAIEHRKGSDNVVADMLSCSVEEVHMAPTDLLGFETTAFGADAYQKLVRKAVPAKPEDKGWFSVQAGCTEVS